VFLFFNEEVKTFHNKGEYRNPGRDAERCDPILLLKIKVTTSCGDQRCGPMGVLVVDEGLRALCRQQRANLRCVTITRGRVNLLTRHSFPAS
jgi:hypothetical protein